MAPDTWPPSAQTRRTLPVRWPFGLLLLVAVWGLDRPARADSINHTLLPVLCLPAAPAGPAGAEMGLDLWQVEQGGAIELSRRDEDLYRRYAGRDLLSSLSRQVTGVSVLLPITRGAVRHSLGLVAAREALRYARVSGADDWRLGLRTAGAAVQVQYMMTAAACRLGVGLGWRRDRAVDQLVRLERFPHARTDRSLNRYLLDLLEPAFGHDLGYDWRNDVVEVEAAGVWAIRSGRRLGLKVHLDRQAPRSRVTYANTGDRAELRGSRQATVRQRWEGQGAQGAIAGQPRPGCAWRCELGAARSRWRGGVQQDGVPTSPSGIALDVIELGAGGGRWRGFELAARGRWDGPRRLSVEGVVGGGRSTFAVTGTGATPVLGFSLATLPISHRGLAVVHGTITSRGAGLQLERPGHRLSVDAALTATHSVARVRTRADAQMEFGLVVQPVRVVSVRHLALYRLSVGLEVPVLSRAQVRYQVTQYLADLSEPGRAPMPVAGRRTRGGSVQQLSLRYAL